MRKNKLKDAVRATARAAADDWDARKKAADAERHMTDRAEIEREREVTERFERAAGADLRSPFETRSTTPSVEIRSSPDERRSLSERRSIDEPRSETPPIAVQNEPRSTGERGSEGERGSSRIRVAWKNGEFRVPNYIVDNLLPLLTQDEAAVYLRLYRLSQYQEGGQPRGWCIIGAPKLIEQTKIRRTALFAAIRGLEDKGLVVREAQEVFRGTSGGRGSQGNRYRVQEPDVEGRPRAELRSYGERRSARELRSVDGHMKDLESKDMKAPAALAPAGSVYEVRTRAARVYETRRHELGFDQARLRTALVTELEHDGLDVDDATIDEAIRGMAGGG